MNNKIKDIRIKTTHTTFSMILSISKFLNQTKSKQMKSHTKIFLFTTLDL